MSEGSAGASHPPGLWPVPGEGVLARHGNLILLSSLDSGQFVDTLLDLLEHVAADGGDGRQFTDQIAGVLEGDDSAQGGQLVLAFGATGSGLAVLVSGGAWADVTTEYGTQRIEAGQPGMLVRCLLRSPVSAVRGGLGAAGNGTPSTDRFSRLDAGTVRADGLSFFSGGPVTGGYPAVAPRPAPVAAAIPAPATPPPAVLPAPAVPPEPVPSEPAPAAFEQPVAEEPVVEQPAVPPPAQPVQAFEPPPPPPPPALPPAPAEQPATGPAGTELWQAPAADQEAGTDLWQEPADAPLAATPPPAGLPPAVPAGQPFVSPPGGSPFPPPAAAPFESVLLLDAANGADLGVVEREPLSKARDIPAGTASYAPDAPIIQGVYCKNGHFDDPEALFCAVCGISMNQQTLVPRPGTRPPLGVLLLDDGSVFQLDRDYIIGREPGLDKSVETGRSRPLRLADDSGIVSRVHAKIALDGWRVVVTDLGSANGTRVKLAKQPNETPLQPHVPLVLTAGSQVDVGGRIFRYESHRGR